MAQASSLSLQSLGTCSSFHAKKLARRYLTEVTYLAIRGSQDSYSTFTCSTTNWESLQIISLLVDIADANSTPARMASCFDSLFEALKPSRLARSYPHPGSLIAGQCWPLFSETPRPH